MEAPAVLRVFPPPLSTFVRYDTAVLWARFEEPLDSTTVNARNVFLKIDEGRYPITVAWDPDSNRILIRPRDPLLLMQTYTVELSSNLRSAGGVPLGQTYRWQFTTNSLRDLSSPRPADGATGESPFAMLAWSGNEGLTVGYDLYAGADSAAVAARTLPPVVHLSGNLWLPRSRWPTATRNWWCLTATNWVTGEMLQGPVWRFDTVDPAAARVDSIILPAERWGWATRILPSRTDCVRFEFISGPGYTCAIAWGLAGQPARLADARIVLSTTEAYAGALPTDVALLGMSRDFEDCTINFTGPPDADDVLGRLATGAATAPRTLVFSSDLLTAHLEASTRYGNFRGYMLRSYAEVRYVSPTGLETDRWPALVLYYYATP